jgi:hypothetical protein
MWLTAADTLRRIAHLGEQTGRVFTLENLNLAADHPGTPFARAADTLALVRAVDSRTCGCTSTSTRPRSARGTSSNSSANACPASLSVEGWGVVDPAGGRSGFRYDRGPVGLTVIARDLGYGPLLLIATNSEHTRGHTKGV